MNTLSVAVVGLNMGKGHLEAYAKLPEYEITALCDLNEELAKEISKKYNIPYYLCYEEMLAKAKPDVVCIVTPTALHCAMTLQAVEAGVKGIYCEKPIAVNMKEARIMDEACKKANIPLVIGHQRRMSEPYVAMKKAIEDGLIGEVYLIRGICAGDMLSDGTHTVDSLAYLNNDCAVSWVAGQIFRGTKATAEEYARNRYAYIGTRFGHNVEQSAIGCYQMVNGVRCEIYCGAQLLMPDRVYQDIEVFGTKGRLWRNNDFSNPPVSINTTGEWEELPVEMVGEFDYGLGNTHRAFARTVREGVPHPMNIDNAMQGFEVVMAIYESARINARIELPLKQDEYPLDMMLRERGDL